MRYVTFHSSEKVYPTLSADMFSLLAFPFYTPDVLAIAAMNSQISIIEGQGPRITLTAESSRGNLLIHVDNYYPLPYILAFKALEDLFFGCFSDDISTLYPSLTHVKHT